PHPRQGPRVSVDWPRPARGPARAAGPGTWASAAKHDSCVTDLSLRPGSDTRRGRHRGRGGGLASNRPGWSERADRLRLGALLSLTDLELDPLVLLERLEAGALDGGVVDEEVGGTILGGGEPVRLLRF